LRSPQSLGLYCYSVIIEAKVFPDHLPAGCGEYNIDTNVEKSQKPRYNTHMKNFMQKLSIFALLLLLVFPVFGQTRFRGAVLDPAAYEQTDAKPVTRSSTVPPRLVSLRQFAPSPGDQGQYGTCTGWATAYAARTISESIALNRTNQAQSTDNAFSPNFVYLGHYLSLGITPTGQEGAVLSRILDFVRTTGAVRRQPFERTTAFNRISFSSFANIQLYPISNYVRLFSNRAGTSGPVEERVTPVRRSLSEGKPVVIGMNTPASFFNARDVWRPHETPTINHGGHAMCVVGYNDDIHGGAFEIQNSWGTSWGNNGYIWITYNDFARYVFEAFEMIENLANYRDSSRFAASINIEIWNSQQGMPVSYDNQGFYRTRTSYPSGTTFRFLMTNRHPAYVYAFAADTNSNEVTRIFPLEGVSPVMDYSDSTIAWPSEEDWMAMDNITGTDYLVVLYSKRELDIASIQRRFALEAGSFTERVARAVGANFIPYNTVQYNASQIEFTAVSNNPSAIFGLLLAIDHHAR